VDQDVIGVAVERGEHAREADELGARPTTVSTLKGFVIFHCGFCGGLRLDGLGVRVRVVGVIDLGRPEERQELLARRGLIFVNRMVWRVGYRSPPGIAAHLERVNLIGKQGAGSG
jgi:hypothetical protein